MNTAKHGVAGYHNTQYQQVKAGHSSSWAETSIVFSFSQPPPTRVRKMWGTKAQYFEMGGHEDNTL